MSNKQLQTAGKDVYHDVANELGRIRKSRGVTTVRPYAKHYDEFPGCGRDEITRAIKKTRSICVKRAPKKTTIPKRFASGGVQGLGHHPECGRMVERDSDECS